MSTGARRSTVSSSDGTVIAYRQLGTGPGVIVVGGALSSGQDYLPLARVLARSMTAYVIDRRGRGHSGPQGPGYSIAKEIEDLLAVAHATGAAAVFGHSYGGLVALEAARQANAFAAVAAYEPGVSIGGSIQTSWIPRYRQLLEAGDRRGAFAAMVQKGGFAPLGKLPLWYARIILRVVVRRRRWETMEPLLEANLAEHEQVARLDDGTADRYRQIAAPVLLLGGSKTPAFITTTLFAALQRVIPDCTAEVINGLDHFAPDQKAPEPIAERLRHFYARDDPDREAARPARSSRNPAGNATSAAREHLGGP